MMTQQEKEKIIQKYAQLLVRNGVNLQKGEHMFLNIPAFASDLARHIAEEAYKAGAKKVTVFYTDAVLSKLGYVYQDTETLSDIPAWQVAQRNHILEVKGVTATIISNNPELFADVDSSKMAAASRAAGKAFAAFRESTMSSKTRWSIGAYPNPDWAKKLFPDLSEEQAVDNLWEYIIKAMRLDADDPVAEWAKHQQNLLRRRQFLNDAKIVSMHYKNSIGTDFTVGLPENYVFEGGSESSADGVPFTANMPTEEVFSAPHYKTAEGVLVASMPLVHNGKKIDGIKIHFKEGRVVDYSATQNVDVLKNIIETDEGSHYLGEIALVGYNSPIQNLKTLFYETLFDENASCHFALGDAYPSCVKGGADLGGEKTKVGLNSSIEHVDFMVGTADLSIEAKTADGKKIVIFANGDWAI